MKRFLIAAMSLLIAFSALAQTTPEPTETVLNNAYATAAKENKKVILIFHASWCSWCHKMEASINDPSCNKFFNDNYVVAYLDVQENAGKQSLENPGGNELLAKYNADKAGLPFWLILDARGNTLANSLMKADGSTSTAATDNVGCPATEKEVDYFVKLLKSTSKLSDGELAIIKTRFRKNEVTKATAGTN
ncbi:MAG: thioredoxin family protein [Bacteroidetes bacterium]|nr:thioredoxin family protein [Bacteroidota bacterium]